VPYFLVTADAQSLPIATRRVLADRKSAEAMSGSKWLPPVCTENVIRLDLVSGSLAVAPQ
jgi:hypothetical protein